MNSASPHVCRTQQCLAENPLEVECDACGLDPICQVLDYAEAGSGVPEGVLLRRQPVARGEILFQASEVFSSIYAIKSGSFKTYTSSPGGGDRVIGFHQPGELIGVEAVSSGSYPCTARALEPSSVCELRISRLPEAGRPNEVVQQALIQLLGSEVAFSHIVITALIQQNGEQRLAAFLLNISNRRLERGLPESEFYLQMSRADIANYLGLASETVSRLLTRFQNQGLITLRRKQVLLRDHAGLMSIIEPN